jgi:TPP-dependent pyruvate/acetoin dehydrogenase alpha subunit
VNSEILFSIWRTMTRIHYFDEQCYRAIEDGRVKCFVYLSSGQEAIAASVAEAFRGYKPQIFCQHRNHAAYLAFGGDPAKLRDQLLQNKHGGDPMFHDPAINFWGHAGLVADQVPIAVGYAFAARTPVVCFLGDSTVEEDVFWPPLGVAHMNELPILFVCEDNGLSVITSTIKRRYWNAIDVLRGYDINALEMMDEPEQVYSATCLFLTQPVIPMFLQVQCCRKYRHVGAGRDGEMAWDQMAIVREALMAVDAGRAGTIESEAIKEMEELWTR